MILLTSHPTAAGVIDTNQIVQPSLGTASEELCYEPAACPSPGTRLWVSRVVTMKHKILKASRAAFN